jgi:hypothetical protein
MRRVTCMHELKKASSTADTCDLLYSEGVGDEWQRDRRDSRIAEFQA